MKVTIEVNGTSYPCYPTMGAMLRYKQQTGHEVTEMEPNNISDACTFLWCCTASASKREGKKFDMDLMDFADAISPEDLMKWNDLVLNQGDPNGELGEDGSKYSGQKKSDPV